MRVDGAERDAGARRSSAPSSHSAAPAAAIAQSPARRLTFSYALPPFVAERDPHLDEHLGVADRGLVRAAVELGHVDDALAARPADHGDARRAPRRPR